MRYLFDSDVVTDLYDKSATGHAMISKRLAALDDSDEVLISILTLYELEYGLANAPEEKKPLVEAKIFEARQNFGVQPLSEGGAKCFGLLKKSLKERRSMTQQGLKKYSIDLMIAATALDGDCVLISSDKMYADIRTSHPELRLENWLEERPADGGP